MEFFDIDGKQEFPARVFCPIKGREETVWFRESDYKGESENQVYGTFSGCDYQSDCDECRACEKEALRVLWER